MIQRRDRPGVAAPSYFDRRRRRVLEMIGDKRTKEYSGHARPVKNGNGLANLAGNFCQGTFCAAGAAHLQVILCRSSWLCLSKCPIDCISGDTETSGSFADVSSGFGIDHKDSSPLDVVQ